VKECKLLSVLNIYLIMDKKNLIFWSFVVLLLFIGILQWGSYLINGGYIVETFSNNLDINTESTSTNHTVDLPLTTKQSCQNTCGPNNRCSLTGEQCSSDVDCFGCNPETKRFVREEKEFDELNIRGENDAGKLTTGETPTYSVLTTDIGTKARLINKRQTDSPQYFQGVNTWRDTFDEQMELYDKRYTPTASYFTPDYPSRKTLSGEFTDKGPLAANAFL
jgi:hypothetical protein